MDSVDMYLWIPSTDEFCIFKNANELINKAKEAGRMHGLVYCHDPEDSSLAWAVYPFTGTGAWRRSSEDIPNEFKARILLAKE